MKTCSKCGETKPLDEFHREKNGRDGRRARCKSCVKAYQAEWRERPEVRAHKAEYRARADVKARVAEYRAEYYASNREALLERNAEYFAANPHRRWVGVYLHRAKKYGFEPVIEPFTKDELVARWGDACWHCGGPFEELDHYVTPVVRGGTHTIENCRPSCTNCNKKTWTKTNEMSN